MACVKWTIDSVHSDVQFRVKYLIISSVTGFFKNFRGGATSRSDSFEDAEIHFSLDVSSVDTNLEARDNHLRSQDFFDARNFPQISFQSKTFRKVKGDLYRLIGLLTIKDITKPVELQAEFGGFATDSEGKTKAGFEVCGGISRWEFGLTYNPLTKKGGLVLSEEIKLIANIQLVQQLESIEGGV